MKRGYTPVRTCRSCRKKAPKNELLRFVLERGHLVDDDQGQGHGFYCCPNADCRTKIDKKLKKQKIMNS